MPGSRKGCTRCLGWANLDFEYGQEVIGGNVYPYGVQANLPTLEAATLFSYEQGLTQRKIDISEIFAPETLAMLEEG